MKLILCFFAIITLATSTYTATFSYCKGHLDIFVPEKVSVYELDPNNKNNLTVSTYGFTVSRAETITFDHIQVIGTAGNHTWNTTVPFHLSITSGYHFCLNYTDDFAKYNENVVKLRVLPYGVNPIVEDIYEAGCVDLKLTKGSDKFLSMR